MNASVAARAFEVSSYLGVGAAAVLELFAWRSRHWTLYPGCKAGSEGTDACVLTCVRASRSLMLYVSSRKEGVRRDSICSVRTALRYRCSWTG